MLKIFISVFLSVSISLGVSFFYLEYLKEQHLLAVSKKVEEVQSSQLVLLKKEIYGKALRTILDSDKLEDPLEEQQAVIKELMLVGDKFMLDTYLHLIGFEEDSLKGINKETLIQRFINLCKKDMGIAFDNSKLF